jgi:hypothetical protein
MRSKIRWASYNDGGDLNPILRKIARQIDGRHIAADQLANIRREILDWLDPVSQKSSLDGIEIEIEDTGLIVQVSHAQAAKSKILEAQEHVHNGSIKSFVIITQTKQIAVLRNRLKNPDSNQTGNRITFEEFTQSLERYTSSFIQFPCAVIGLDVA